jgi:hypothetical protein
MCILVRDVAGWGNGLIGVNTGIVGRDVAGWGIGLIGVNTGIFLEIQ